MRILVTGSAGFIGASVCKKLLNKGERVFGIDNLNSYYDKELKEDRLKNIENNLQQNHINWSFKKVDLTDAISLQSIFVSFRPNVVVNLAAQAGVRYSIKNPSTYIQSNIVGFNNLLEKCVQFKVENLIYASSSSVYGNYEKEPFSEDDPANHPLSLYAATKRSNELMAHAFSNIHKIPSTGLRFFTVYGPWGRPDMAPFIFTKSIIENKPISVFNYGDMLRDFTFIDDVAEAVYRCCLKKAKKNEDFDYKLPDLSTSFAPHRIFNVGNSKPINILKFIAILEKELDKKAIINLEQMQKGDVKSTHSDIKKFQDWVNFKPKTSIEEGIKLFTQWYIDYFRC